MALTAIIEEELLATIGTDTDPEAVIHRYHASKGPLYTALARATATAQDQFDEVAKELESATQALETLQSQARALTGQIAQLQADKAEVTAQQSALQSQVDRHQASLNALRRLGQHGFDPATLDQFACLVQNMATTTQQPPMATVRQFFAHVQDYAHLVQLPRQVANAEQHAQAAIAAAVQRKQQATVHTQTIRAAEWLVQHQVTRGTVTAWQAISKQLHLSSEDLAQGLASALQTYGTWTATESALATQIATLRETQSHLASTVHALRDEQSTITQSLQAVEQEGCRRIQAVAAQAQQAFQVTVDHLAQLQGNAAALGTAVAWAQALQSDDPAVWQQVDAAAWLGFWAKFQQWVATKADTREFPVPQMLRGPIEQQAQYPSLYGPVRASLADLTEWVGTALHKYATQALSGIGE